MRRRDLRVDDETLFEFYDERIGPDVVSERHFDKWWKDARADDPTLLDFDPDAVLAADAEELDASAFPKTWQQGSFELPLSYEFYAGGARRRPGSVRRRDRARAGAVPEPAGRQPPSAGRSPAFGWNW